MSTDLLTQLSEYGAYHREMQEPVQPGDSMTRAVTPAPDPEPDYLLRRIGAALLAAAVVVLLIAIPAMLRGPAEGPAESVATTVPVEPPTTIAATTIPPVEADPEVEYEGYVMVQRLGDDSLVGLQSGSVWRSTDDGVTWEVWYEQAHEIDVIAVAPDGTLLAVRNPNSYSPALGEGSTVNDTPEVHRFDQTSGQWSVIGLPRPDLPDNADAEAGECPLGGIQSWVDGNAAVVGDRIVILGDHRVVADGICDDDFQFLWTSSDGMEWSLVPSLDIDGYLAGIEWFQESYVGFGSARPFYVGGGGPMPRVWTSADLATWVERTLDLSSIPSDGYVQVDALGQTSHLGTVSVGTTTSDGRLAASFQVFRDRPGLDSIESIQQLEQWLSDAGSPPQSDPDLEELLASIDVTFPMDREEADELAAFFGMREPNGTLTVSTADGIEWESAYTP